MAHADRNSGGDDNQELQRLRERISRLEARLAIFGPDGATAATATTDTALQATERLHQLMMKAMPGGVVIVGTDGAILHVNDEGQRILGFSYDEATERYVQDWEPQTYWEDGRPCAAEDYPVTRCMVTGEAQGPATIGVQRPDGALSWAVFNAVPVKDERGGALRGVMVTFLDVTDRIEAERRLADSEARFRVLFEHAGVGMALFDATPKLVRANDALLALLGGEASALLGKNPIERSKPQDTPVIKEALERVQRDAEATPVFEMRYPRLDGQEIWLRIHLSRLAGAQTEGPLLLAIVEDVTDRRDAERALEQKQKLQSLGVLAGGIAHDFNNLLVGVMGNATLALSQLPTDSPIYEAIEGVESAAERAADLCGQLLAYSGRGHFSLAQVDVSKLAAEMVGLLEHALAKSAELTLTLAPELPPVVADASQLRQVVMNLITNASDAVAERGGLVRLRTGVRRLSTEALRSVYLGEELPAGEYVFIEVVDDGVGMSRETLARLFDPFYTTKAMGRGLGLAAALGIIRGHHGSVRVDSQLGRGTTFTVYFPASDAGAALGAGPTEGEAEPRSLAGRQVLIIDDDATVRALFELVLGRAGAEVLLADSGTEGLRIHSERGSALDLIIVDLTMPKPDGAQTLRTLRAQGARMPVLITSGYDAESSLEALSALEPAGFIAKPFDVRTLLQRIESVLN